MIKTIHSSQLKTYPDLVCTHCSRDHRIFIDGKLMGVEGVDFVFETDGNEEWCICKSCQEEQDKKELWFLCTEQLPLFGKALKIKLTNGLEINAFRVESSFDEVLGYLYEGLDDCSDYYQKDVLYWRYL